MRVVSLAWRANLSAIEGLAVPLRHGAMGATKAPLPALLGIAQTRRMHASILIERIVRQTTVLIAQLSTAAGIRAPLAHLADQVFVELAREIESQGVPRKVAADMFGLALRTYQRKVQRLAESATQRNTTLWEAVLDHVRQQESVSRGRLLQRFASDDPEQVAAVITDLVASGLLYASGRGAHAMYRALSADERREVAESNELDAVAGLLWLTIYRRKAGSTVDELAAELGMEGALVERGLAQLLGDGRIEKSATGAQERFSAQTFLVPIGAERGWEAAVCDHFTAVASAIASKLARGPARSAEGDVVGGATYAFDLHDAHPHRARVLALLREERARVGALWDEVRQHNAAHPVDESARARVTFYFGQHVIEADGQDRAAEAAGEAT
jgi:hypothetical protein